MYDIDASLLVITGAGKTRSRDDDVIMSVTVDVSADHVTANMTSLSVVLFLAYWTCKLQRSPARHTRTVKTVIETRQS